MQLSVQLALAGPFSAIVERAELADRLGFSSIGAGQIAARDPLATLAAISMRTHRIELGTSVLPIYPRSPASMAQAAATIDDLSGGRFQLGLGVGHRVTMGDWHGQEIGKPVSEMREYVGIVQAILQGRPSPAGARWHSTFALVGVEPARSIPLHLAGLSPAMLRLAGEIADGVVLWTTPPDYIRDVVLPAVAEGRRRRGLSLAGFAVMPVVPAAFVDERARAISGVRTELHRYFGLPFYRAMFTSAGFADDVAAYDAAAPDVERQKAAISLRFIDHLCIFGDRDDLARGFDRYEAAGATNLILSAPTTTQLEPTLLAAAHIQSLPA